MHPNFELLSSPMARGDRMRRSDVIGRSPQVIQTLLILSFSYILSGVTDIIDSTYPCTGIINTIPSAVDTDQSHIKLYRR